MICCNDNFFVHIWELVGSDVYNEIAFLKPAMGESMPTTPDIIKIAETTIKETFRKQMRCSATASGRKFTKTGKVIGKKFYVTIFDRFPKNGCDFVNFFTIDAIHTKGKYLIETDYGTSIKKIERNYKELRDKNFLLRAKIETYDRLLFSN